MGHPSICAAFVNLVATSKELPTSNQSIGQFHYLVITAQFKVNTKRPMTSNRHYKIYSDKLY